MFEFNLILEFSALSVKWKDGSGLEEHKKHLNTAKSLAGFVSRNFVAQP